MGDLVQARARARQLKDATQVRGIVQSLVVFAQNNKDSYPLPGVIDTDNATIALAEGGSQESKNTTANILSILIFNGNISTEIAVSPAEVSRRIKADEDYMFTSPATAAKPASALWDPAFSADFTRREPGGNVSYAHLQPSGTEKTGRRTKWGDTFSTTEAVVGNRAPAIREVKVGEDGAYEAVLKGEKSKTFRIHGDPKTWEGNVAFNDGHVEFVTSLSPQKPPASWVTYMAKDEKGAERGKSRLDCWYYDEPDDQDGANLYLGIWTKAGERASEFKGIWD
jgi:prepilin-type processing-associated H-X9-DG protein